MRVTIAAGAGRDDGHGLPGLQEALRPDRRLDARAVHDATAAAFASTEEAPRRRLLASAVDEGVALVILRADLPPESEAAAPSSGTTGVLDERVTLDHQWVLRLERLHRQVGRVRDVHVHPVEAVLRGPRPGAAADGLEVHVELPGPGIHAAE